MVRVRHVGARPTLLGGTHKRGLPEWPFVSEHIQREVDTALCLFKPSPLSPDWCLKLVPEHMWSVK